MTAKTSTGVRFRPAEEVAEVAAPIMDEWHEDLCEVEVRFTFRSKAESKGGREVWGTAEIVKGKNAYRALGPNPPEGGLGPGEGEYFEITIAEPVWHELGEEQRKALVDHELMHCRVERDDDGTLLLRTRPHDLEEFIAVVGRHGYWRGDVRAMADQMLDVAANGFGVDLRGDR